MYWRIAIEIFKYKIITKILANKLTIVLPQIISKEQYGFIQGRSIKDCICLTSEVVNIVHTKTLGGNIDMKVDIAKTFDTLNLSLLFKCLKQFGFNYTFYGWIECILQSLMLLYLSMVIFIFTSSVIVVRHGDPLSPFFVLYCRRCAQ